MVRVIHKDITALDVDAIVNAANSSLLGGGGVDGAIHSAAGPRLREYNRKHKGCSTGQAVLSPGFDLKARWIISTVGPVWNGGTGNEAQLLKSCYVNCLEIAVTGAMQSIAFPAISTGIFGYPKREAAQIALNTMLEYEKKLAEIYACCFDQEDYELQNSILAEIRGS